MDLKVKNTKILAQEYGVCSKTMVKWLVKANLIEKDKNRNRIFTPSELEKIYAHLGKP